jgi:phenylalanyl-tRNA synthetase beta subunit
MTFQIASEQAYQNLYQLIETNLSATGLRYAIEPISIYQGDDKAIKNISFRLNLNATDRTLTGDEVAIVIDKISHDADEKLNAKVI